jgi:predicted nucleic acid-binding protein
MYTIDASVWVNSFDHQEPGHETSRQFLAFLGQETVLIAAPTLVLAEVAGAISRTRKDWEQASTFALALSNLPNLTLINLDSDLAEQSLHLAAKHGLRGADAVYAAVAIKTGFTLISLDREHLTRLTTVITVKTPSDVLTDLTPRS